MTDFTPSDSQLEAMRAIKGWYKLPATRRMPWFYLAGFGGTGKSSLVKHTLLDLGLSGTDVVNCSYTGKAALVMRRLGVKGATTIHKLIYRLVEPSDAEFQRLARDCESLERRASRSSDLELQALFLARAAHLRKTMLDLYTPRFVLDYAKSPANKAKLIVLDEVSMVGDGIAKDLLSFGTPILVIGDPGQLPPIKGQGYFTSREPNVMLTEIHRQAAESPIIRLATMARNGESIPYGDFGPGVSKVRRMEATPARLLEHEQVICAMNNTRRDLNNRLRCAAGYRNGDLPTGKGEKVICKKNDYEHGLVNGMFLDVRNVRNVGGLSFQAEIRDADGNGDAVWQDQRIYTGFFKDHVKVNTGRNQRDWKAKKELVLADWAYALTVHTMQGSSARTIGIVNDGFHKWGEDRHKMLYTAITRAEEGLVIYE